MEELLNIEEFLGGSVDELSRIYGIPKLEIVNEINEQFHTSIEKINQKNFILNALSEIPNIKFRYEYDSLKDLHLIEVPTEALNDNSFLKFRIKLRKEFESKYIEDEIVFITNNDLLKINDNKSIKVNY